uniref:Uncharacterized protein n=1 Tax=Gracilaria vermiculophylla TaxID=2608709 RepID=A0A345U8X6_9FLOR|nr:hypothetical protein [Gracilaria vermiculophylla]AXI96912.1 hypothetical protein [Gracilaria vermiculophylla]
MPNKILNFYKLEDGISFLKRQGIIQNFTYDVDTLPKGLILKIKYSLNQNEIQSIYSLDNMKTLKYNIIIFFKKLKYIIQMSQFKYSINLLNTSMLLEYKRSFALQFIYNWNFIQKLQIKMNTSLNSTKINIKLSLLKIVNTYVNSYLFYGYYNLYNYRFIYNSNYIQILNSNPFIKEESNLKIITENFTIGLQYYLKNNLNIVQKCLIQYEEKSFVSLYQYSYKNMKISKYKHIFNVSKLIKRKVLYVLLALEYPQSIYSSIGKYFNKYLQFLSYTNLKTSRFTYYTMNFHPYITFNYDTIFNLPLVIPSIYKNILKFKLKIHILDIIKHLTPIKLYSNTCEYNKNQEIYNSRLINKGRYLFNIQYEIYPLQCIAIYYIINYTKILSYKVSYLPDIYSSRLLYKHYNQQSIGINLYLPFKQKPIIFIEYPVNDKHKKNVYIGINFT